MTRFVYFAVDWDRVFAVNFQPMSLDRKRQEVVAVYVDLPHVAVDQPAAVLDGTDAWTVWQAAKADRRFRALGDKSELLVDLDKVAAVFAATRSVSAYMIVALPSGRSGPITLPPEVGLAMLDVIGQPRVDPIRSRRTDAVQ